MLDIKEMLEKDSRFYINKESLDFITQRPISAYSLEDITVGQIRRRKNGKIYSLYKTEPYLYLMSGDDQKVKSQYEDYCLQNTMDNSARSTQLFDSLIREWTDMTYDVQKGIIIVDQYNIIADGQHRACILLKKYGNQYKIKVLRIYYDDYGIGTALKNVIYDIKRKCKMDC